ncbi:Uncharacterized protein Fot_38201 [Forsythia ovata]|uniref:Uncharacterized protein n=1 Tax=Forsythia ovata TaxID=205694 RepID=A0ABD1S2N2_9LAMI
MELKFFQLHRTMDHKIDECPEIKSTIEGIETINIIGTIVSPKSMPQNYGQPPRRHGQPPHPRDLDRPWEKGQALPHVMISLEITSCLGKTKALSEKLTPYLASSLLEGRQ